MESENAVRVFGDGTEEFPVLKAFQQYIDAEQNKARKRMVTLSVFFGILMALIVAVFLFLLSQVSARNQALNDRLLDYMMRKESSASPVVVQPSTDNTAVLNLSAKLETMQKALEESKKENEKLDTARRERLEQERRDLEKRKFDEALEQERQKFKSEVEQLKAEIEKTRATSARESERKRQQEIEAYRRKYYPEYYKTKAAKQPAASGGESEEEIDALLDELSIEPIQYFDEPAASTSAPAATTPSYEIPVEVKGTRKKWRIPTT